ncbi:MAG: hypothetical protein A2428_05545 [Bdellovibrionales bacterium RIFOXYC1_FULL_54_43]|nr:MAG: hypothetical protein A2428_05545 [Bdellovibrionales bacterium RIFOXYC1_FULL_54_43]
MCDFLLENFLSFFSVLNDFPAETSQVHRSDRRKCANPRKRNVTLIAKSQKPMVTKRSSVTPIP